MSEDIPALIYAVKNLAGSAIYLHKNANCQSHIAFAGAILYNKMRRPEMKINLMCSGEHRGELESMLVAAGFELSPLADYILYENSYILERVAGKVGDDIVLLDCPDIVL